MDDSTGRLLTHSILLDDGQPLRTVRCSYDADGRLQSSVEYAPDGSINGGVSYTYGAGTRSIRIFGREHAATMALEEFDAEGRITRSTSRNETTGELEDDIHYDYRGDTRRECSDRPGWPTSCLTLRFDPHAREIERRGDDFGSVGRFDYDDTGNWIVHVSHDVGRELPGTWDSATWRDIVYRR